MAYDLYNAYLKNSTTPMQGYLNDLQNVVNNDFEDASDVYTIQEETDLGSKQFSDVEVRITHVIQKPSTSANSSTILGDDLRQLIFKDLSHTCGMGYMYLFDNNYWLTTFTDLYKYPTSNAAVRRCNNRFKWKDENNNVIQEPCIMDYIVNRDKLTIDSVNLPMADIKVTAQNNSNTSKITLNQRFIFNGQVYKVQRIQNFLQQETMNPDSVTVISFSLYKDNKAPDDDFVNGIANTNQYLYSLVIDQNSFNNVIGTTGTLTATVKLNNNIVSKNLQWTSSDSTIVSIDNNGNYNLLQNGTVTITCCLAENNLVSNTINITVSSVPVITNEIKISPNVTELHEGDGATIFTVYKYNNNVQQSDVFDFVDSGITNNSGNQYYTFTKINGNSFSIACNQYYDGGNLIITCTDTSDNSVQTLNLALVGAI